MGRAAASAGRAPSLTTPLAPRLAMPISSLGQSALCAAARSPIAIGLPTALPAAQVAAAPRASLPSAAAAPGQNLEQASQAWGEERHAEAGRPFDGSKPGGSLAADLPVIAGPEQDIKLSASDNAAVASFTAGFHETVSSRFRGYEFTIRDYYAWARFIRFYTPAYGIKEAARRGAAYVYGDRLESEAEYKEFSQALDESIKGLKLAKADHGQDKAKANQLQKLAAPAPETLRPDEESPFQMPLAALVPDQAMTGLVLTPTTLSRIEAADKAFAMRDYALLLGPPATQKSAIPKYLAAQYGIPHMAVTMHPGIGTFELVGGYRPKAMRLGSLEAARRSIRAKLQEAAAASDYVDVLESAAKVYGASGLQETLKAVESDLALDLDATAQDQQARRRLLTLAHGLEFGASSLVWQDGYLSYAIKRDIHITFEEINAAPTESQEFLNDFMRTRRLVVTQKLGEPEALMPRPGGRFMLWATMNPETDPNREILAQTLKNRWRVKYFGELPSTEQAEIIEKKFGLPSTWALALVENFHKEVRRLAINRQIGDAWRDGYEVNLRHLMRAARRWRFFADQEAAARGQAPSQDRQLRLLAREVFSVYGGMMRSEDEKNGLFRILDQALKLSSAGVHAAQDLTERPDRIEDLGERILIGDVVLAKGRGGKWVPKPNADYLADPGTLARLYEYAKALALGEPLLVMGESAAGKTTDLEYLFFRLNMNLRYKNLDSDTAIEEVVGGFAPGKRRGEFVYAEGVLPAAMEEGSGLFLDEFNLNSVVEWLNTVTDDGRLYLPHRIVEGRPLLVAAANPPDPRYPGRILLSPAVRSRYHEVWAPLDMSSNRLKSLMEHWLKGGMIYEACAGLGNAVGSAFEAAARGAAEGSNVLSTQALPSLGGWIKGLFGSKKKAAAQPDDEELAAPARLEDLLKAHGIAEAAWDRYRAKVDRIRTTMRMVGSAVGRDTSLKWEPGDLWAYFPDLNVATYPVEHLVTHSEEELVGLIDHESLHREITVLDDRFALVRKYQEDPLKHFLWNGLEDPRVNSRGIHRLPGAQRYLHALYDRYLPKDLEAPAPVAGDGGLDVPKGDGGTAFNAQVLQYPHIEFVMAANYFWRHGQRPARFFNKSVEKAFDQALPDMREIFSLYPQDNEPSSDEKLAYTLEALKLIDAKVLPLYEPLVKESEKKLARQRKGRGKGKSGKGSGAPQPGGRDRSDPNPKPNGKQNSGGQEGEGQGGPGQSKKQKDAGPGQEKQAGGDGQEPSAEDLAWAREQFENHARDAAQELGNKIQDNPKRKKASGRDSTAKGSDHEPGALTIEDIAQAKRAQILNRDASPYQKAFEQVAHLSNAMVTHLENIFQKNSRPKDVGYYRSGKRLDIKRYMRREGEGSGRDDFMLRRSQATKRRYKVTLLIDESGSMLGSKGDAVRSTVLLVDSLARLQIDVEVIGFSDRARIHKEFKEPLTAAVKDRLASELQEFIGQGNTHDADALKLAVERIMLEEGDRRMIFVVTDGVGNGPSSLADALDQAGRSSIWVVGVGVGEGMAYVQTAYPHHVSVNRIDELAVTLKKALEEYVSRQENLAASGRRALAFLPGASGFAPGQNAFSSNRRPLLNDDYIRWAHWLAAVAMAVGLPTLFAALGWPVLGSAAVVIGLAGGVMIWPLIKLTAPECMVLGGLVMSSLAWYPMPGYMGICLLGGFTGAFALAAMPVIYAHRKFGALVPQVYRALRAVSPAIPSNWTQGLLNRASVRKATLHDMALKASQAEDHVDMLEVLASRDSSPELRAEALLVLAAVAETSDLALEKLRRLSVMGGPLMLFALKLVMEVEAKRSQKEAEQAPLEELDKIVRRAGDQTDMEALIRESRAAAQAQDVSTLAGRLRQGALEEGADDLERAVASGDNDAAAIAAKRLKAQLDGSTQDAGRQ